MSFSEKEIMTAESFPENFAENYNEIVENEEEAHKEELKQEGFYEEAVEEATNKAIEETKEDLSEKVIELDPEGAGASVSDKEKEAVSTVLAAFIVNDFMEKTASADAIIVHARGLGEGAPVVDTPNEIPQVPSGTNNVKSMTDKNPTLPKSAEEK